MRRNGRMPLGSVLALSLLTLITAVFCVVNSSTSASGAPRPHAHSSASPCGTPPPSRASAVAVSAKGKIRWTRGLTDNEQDANDNVKPVAVGDTAYFAQGGTVAAIRISNGKSMWSWTEGKNVSGMWTGHGVLAVLTDEVGDHARLTGLDVNSGSVKWQRSIPGRGLLGTPQATNDGGLAWLRADGHIQVVDLGTGRVRWTLSENPQDQPVPTAVDGLILIGWNGNLHAFADQTGQRRWTIPGAAVGVADQLEASMVIDSNPGVGQDYPTAITAVDPMTGKLIWSADVGTDVTVLSPGPAGVAVAAYVPNRRLYLLNSQTGKPIWQVDTAIALNTVPVVSANDILSLEGGVVGYPGIRLVDRDTATGKARWKRGLSGTPSGSQDPVVPAGSTVVVETFDQTDRSVMSAYEQSDGRLAWRTVMPEMIQVPPIQAKGLFLVQASTPVYACPD
jgi:outer membrane protein assembly factor BamB